MQQRIYRATQAGLAAMADGASDVPLACRRILGLLEGDTHFTVIKARMPGCLESEVLRWLKQLETSGFVQSHAAGAERDLDFTGSFSLAALASRPNGG